MRTQRIRISNKKNIYHMKKGTGIVLIILGILNIVRTIGALSTGYSTGSEAAMGFFWVLVFIVGGVLLIRSASKNKPTTEIEESKEVDKKDTNNGAIISNKHPSSDKEIVKNKIILAFEERIQDTLKNQLVGASAADGLILYSTITSTPKIYKENKTLQQMSGLSQNDYNSMIDNIVSDMMHKYLR